MTELKSVNNALESVWSLQASQGCRGEVLGNLYLLVFWGFSPALSHYHHAR